VGSDPVVVLFFIHDLKHLGVVREPRPAQYSFVRVGLDVHIQPHYSSPQAQQLQNDTFSKYIAFLLFYLGHNCKTLQPAASG